MSKVITIAGIGAFQGYVYTVFLSDIYLMESVKDGKCYVLVKCDNELVIEVTASEFCRIQKEMKEGV